MRILCVATLTLATLALSRPAAAQHYKRNVLTADEIANGAQVTTAYDAVARLRPMWLNPHDMVFRPSGEAGQAVQPAQVRVYLNDFNVGDIDYLKSVAAETVQEMRFLSQNETASRYGPTEGQVAIVLILKKIK
ncbi:MAG TPA: hypothetical protein VKB63_00115 [Gemmatimonadales bacterium]|nr:hypothetical protein [Gemmatimonadales bacterium]